VGWVLQLSQLPALTLPVIIPAAAQPQHRETIHYSGGGITTMMQLR
jgi:hypothetical protein